MDRDQIFKSSPDDPEALLKEFFDLNPNYSEEDQKKISSAWDLLLSKTRHIKRACGKVYYLHPLRVANILAINKLDADTIVAAILHPIHKFGVDTDQINTLFGPTVSNILVTTNKIISLPLNSKTLHQSEAIRRMLFAMCDDARIILLTLSDRLDRIRNIKSLTEEQQRALAESVIEIWAPLADRLGMQKEKNELEDLSLKYNNPKVYKQIQDIVSQSQEERAAYLDKAVQSIYKSTEKMGIHVTITSRAKHYYSIYQKMRKRNKEASELYDLLALRILCQTPAECYMLIGIVHGLWKPLDGRFKDYIAMPKANGYQSLHTTVMCEGKPLEIQIRTVDMHNMAEHGIASHWLYKKGTNHDLVEADKLDIFNKLQQFKEHSLTNEVVFNTLKNELLGDEIYVFTPKGDVKKLPMGATAIDFAYSIHSAIGEKIIAAKADGKIIPLSKELKNTQIIEVITNPQAHPTEAQLNLVKTSKAHQKIHSWLMANDPTFSEKLALAKESENESLNQGEKANERKVHKKRPKKNPDGENIVYKNYPVLVQGDRNVLYNLAQCCKPHYPNLIVGYVTRSKGISVHRADCLIYQRIPDKERKTVEVSWDKDEKNEED
ncbi:MAG: HD domain-containing protein [Treponema sp.]|nr:HD domain-containing protein [Treponema sp.]